jgi:8-oxo-dGTP pyrophosphatase MutT (NUDIX family)
MTDRQSLVSALKNYQTSFQEEQPFIPKFLGLLEHADAFGRLHLPGHVTGSAWIVNNDLTKVLLVKHAKLNKWLQPGGHADGDENVLRVALKEVDEETGLKNLYTLTSGIFDIDIHMIPARKDLSFPEHDHYDIRFVFKADEQDTLVISDESTDLKWIPLADLEKYNSERSILRLREKMKYLS